MRLSTLSKASTVQWKFCICYRLNLPINQFIRKTNFACEGASVGQMHFLKEVYDVYIIKLFSTPQALTLSEESSN